MVNSHELGPQQLKYMTVRSDSSALLILSLLLPCLSPGPEPLPGNLAAGFEEEQQLPDVGEE